MTIRDQDPPAPAAETVPSGRPGRQHRARLDAAIRNCLGQNLRLLYAGVLDQPLPERFAQLLDDLSDTTDTGRGA